MSTSLKVKKSSAQAVQDFINYIKARKDGTIKSLRSKYTKLDSFLMGGFELNTIVCISAMSGSGKSTISKTLRDSFHEKNKDMKFKTLVFNFELLAHQQVARSVVSKTKIPLRKLLSVDAPLSDADYKGLEQLLLTMSRHNVTYIEEASTADEMFRFILDFWETECREKKENGEIVRENYTLLIEVDHALLTLGEQGDKEKDKIDRLMFALIRVKKYIAARGGSSISIVLSQMNREMMKLDRLSNPEFHIPNTSSLFGASSIEQACDYIIFCHIPATLQISAYTSEKLPTKYFFNNKVYELPYFHIAKNRSGERNVSFPLINKLHFFDFDEMDSNIFKQLHADFKASEYLQIPTIKQPVLDL